MRSPRSGGPSVRILAGRWKGRRLRVPTAARPTSGRARQALFNLLQDRVAGARVLDLYAGTGAVGLEAVSRGAASAVLVETDAEPLRRTLALLETAPEEVRLLPRAARAAVVELLAQGQRFDIVFADPPYALAEGDPEIERIGGLLAPRGVLVLQRDRRRPPPSPAGLRPLATREYGRNVFHLFGIL